MNEFLKMHGLGNDFVILDQRQGTQALMPDWVARVSDRHRGVGCDQLIVMEPSENADIFMRIYNADGAQAQACGNATRCVAHFYMSEQDVESCLIETLGGLLSCSMAAGYLVTVDMGEAQILDENLEIPDENLPKAVSVTIGNPHCVFFVDDVEAVDLEIIGPKIEHHDLFPERTNVEFVQVRAENDVRVRVWERGAGITQACGSGACAVAAAAYIRGLTERKINLEMDGGVLQMEVRESDNHILMTGPVSYVFEGSLVL